MDNRESGVWVSAHNHPGGQRYEDDEDEEEEPASVQNGESRGREEARPEAA